MSRTVINPKNGTNLFRAPDNGIDCALIGRICQAMGAPYETRGVNPTDPTMEWADMLYHATRKQCQEMSVALLTVPDSILQEIFDSRRHCFAESYTLENFREFCTYYGRYLKRLKHGYIESGDYRHTRVQKTIHKLMPRALLWSVTNTEEKFREWLERPNSDFPGNMAPCDFLWKSNEPGRGHLVDIVRGYIEKRLLGFPT
jgi:hypothetical protein